ncbi:MAG: lysyl-tRNA synthetase, class [Thermoleophilaceae bacterium]|nr:lysyl-tRNA synthetase, class [Thermoleophilaceae bacterium]
MITLERHAMGPRLHVLGRRVHECHVGLGLAGAAGLSAALGVGVLPAVVLAVVALWLVAKDWRDLRAVSRDTAAWSLGMHRTPGSGPPPSLRDRLPALAAAATATAGAINVASVMTSELPARARALLALAPAGEVRLAHVVALPAGLALIGVAWPLVRRRRRSLHLAVGLLVALGVLNLLKGLDIEEAVMSWAVAALLWRSRAAFWVRHERRELGRAVGRAATRLAAAVAAGVAVLAAAGSHALGGLPPAAVPEAAMQLLTLTGGPAFRAPLTWLPQALGILGAVAVAGAAAALLAPLRAREPAGAGELGRAAALVRRHGNDTLSAFKLRRDVARHYSADGRAVAAYRVEARTLLVAGDPVGPVDAVPDLIDELVAFSRARGLALGVVGASEQFAALARQAGLRRIYLGDEAILPTGAMDLSGRSMKSLRKAVNRVERNSFMASAHAVGELDRETLDALDGVSARWRVGAPERGFSMAHDALADELLPDAVVVLARDADGRVRGFLHFVPVFGRAAMSLAFMRRDRDTPNGLTDFLVVAAARLLGERGIEEFSLNFATAGRWLRAPANVVERELARALRLADRWFQIERLLRFTAKFGPRWQPRYLLVGSPWQLPRVAMAALWAEGQLPRPNLPRPRRHAFPQPALI